MNISKATRTITSTTGPAQPTQPQRQEVQAAHAPATSPSLTQVQQLARYAARASFDDLSPASRAQLPIHILDSLGCCIAALGAGPVTACRQQVADFGGASPRVLIGGGQANPVYAAFWHTALVRYVDFMDNFLAPTETCHTPTHIGGAITIGVAEPELCTLAPFGLFEPPCYFQGEEFEGLWQSCLLQLPDASLGLDSFKPDQCTRVPTIDNGDEDPLGHWTILRLDPRAVWSNGMPVTAEGEHLILLELSHGQLIVHRGQ